VLIQGTECDAGVQNSTTLQGQCMSNFCSIGAFVMKASQDRVFQGFLLPGVGVSGGATVRGASFSQTKKRKKLHRSFVACVGRNQVNAVRGFIKTLASFVNRRRLSFHLCPKCPLDDIADDGAKVTVSGEDSLGP
jgi:hypothetical protein